MYTVLLEEMHIITKWPTINQCQLLKLFIIVIYSSKFSHDIHVLSFFSSYNLAFSFNSSFDILEDVYMKFPLFMKWVHNDKVHLGMFTISIFMGTILFSNVIVLEFSVYHYVTFRSRFGSHSKWLCVPHSEWSSKVCRTWLSSENWWVGLYSPNPTEITICQHICSHLCLYS